MDELAAGWAAGQPVVDVREPWEYAQGHVPGALPIPLKLLAEHLVDIPDGDTVYVICASGNRSLRSAQILRSLGRNAVSAIGWNDAMDGSEPAHPDLTTRRRPPLPGVRATPTESTIVDHNKERRTNEEERTDLGCRIRRPGTSRPTLRHPRR
ncbi:rhodanese-like domain-containing protein [Mycobacterium lehmannii]|uniref:rhodanese-like domain-containing protein n=1 Tax=Mycobacterium lehmannii TaxID=2048550 RepID=UPI002FCE3414